MAEIWEMAVGKVIHGLIVLAIALAVILLIDVIWRLSVHFVMQSRIESAKRIYNAIKLEEPRENAVALFRGYKGGKDHYTEEALLTNGKREVVLCLLFGFGRGERGEIRLTYVDDLLVQKQQNGIW